MMDSRRGPCRLWPFLFVLFACALPTGPPAFAQENIGPLDGLAFAGEAGQKGEITGEKEVLVFRAGRLRSKTCDAYGFGEGLYTASVSAESITFTAETVSATEGKILWKGTVKGEDLTGSFIWYRTPKWYRFFLSHAPVEYWVKGMWLK